MKLFQNKMFAVFAAAPLFAAAVAALIVGLSQPAWAATVTSCSGHCFAVGAVTPSNGYCALGHVAFAAQQHNLNYNGDVEEQTAASANAGGHVVCVGFSANKARVVWKIDHSNDPTNTPVGTMRYFDVTDNGSPSVMPDDFTDGGPCGGLNQPSCGCPNPMAPGSTMPVLNGNIVIKEQ